VSGELKAQVDSVVWFHTIDLGDGIVTPGYSKSDVDHLLPDFSGRSVLDIGAWDGYYSFLAEKRGAARVLALDHYAWGVDFARRNPYWVECHEKGVLPDMNRDLTDFWNPELPGMGGFRIAHEALHSRVETRVDDFMSMDVDSLGTFDVVMFLGVLYHLREPLRALDRLRKVTKGVAVIETGAVHFGGAATGPLLKFTAGTHQGHDFSNWFFPNAEALVDMCRAAGFSGVEIKKGPPAPTPAPPRRRIDRIRDAVAGIEPPAPSLEPVHYRLLVHAFA
jgi:tRNA (mo5U34)-methyltransferase